MQIIGGKKNNHKHLSGNSSESRKLDQFFSSQERFQNSLGSLVALPCPIYLSRTTWIGLAQKCFPASFYLWQGNVWLGLSQSWLQCEWLSTIKKFSGKLSISAFKAWTDWLSKALVQLEAKQRSWAHFWWSFSHSCWVVQQLWRADHLEYTAFSGYNW